jgi:hypothetical protein
MVNLTPGFPVGYSVVHTDNDVSDSIGDYLFLRIDLRCLQKQHTLPQRRPASNRYFQNMGP